MKQQTPIELLIEKLLHQKSILKDHFQEGEWNKNRCAEIDNCIEICENAKEMEKEQSLELIKQTAMFMSVVGLDKDVAKMDFEDVYNSYYNGEINFKDMEQITTQDLNPFSREELINIRTRLTNLSKIYGTSPTWVRAYTNASDAIDRLDAMISRTIIPDCDVVLD